VEFGEKIIATAVRAFGTVHILINNAGILRDIAFRNMKDDDWNLIMKVHVKGSYKVSQSHSPYLMHLSDQHTCYFPFSAQEQLGPFSGNKGMVE